MPGKANPAIEAAPAAAPTPRPGKTAGVRLLLVASVVIWGWTFVAMKILLAHVTPVEFPRLATIFADTKYHNHTLAAWMATHRTGWRIEVKARPEGTQGFTPLTKRWVVERTNAWNGRYRRNSKDY